MTQKGSTHTLWDFLGDFLAHNPQLTFIIAILFSVNHSFIVIRLGALVKDKRGRFEKPLKINIH